MAYLSEPAPTAGIDTWKGPQLRIVVGHSTDGHHLRREERRVLVNHLRREEREEISPRGTQGAAEALAPRPGGLAAAVDAA